jgi:hypothetical protein
MDKERTGDGCAMPDHAHWQLEGTAPELYQRYLVPSMGGIEHQARRAHFSGGGRGQSFAVQRRI